MAKSILRSIRSKLVQGADSGDGSDEIGKRIADVAAVFPEDTQIVPAEQIDPDWCFEITLPDGERFLAWTALKEFSGITDQDRKEPFPDSVKARDLDHTNILTPVHITREGDHSIVVTEYFDGTLLINRIDDHEFDQKAVMTIFFQVASTFHTAHREGVIHRAISPANILIDSELNVRVFGFGLANMFFDRWLELLRNHKRRRVDYIAPEVLTEGLFTSVPHCDGYSVARIVYELLTGQIPKTNFAVLPSKLCNVPPHLDDALLNAMHGDPTKRPQTLAALQKQYAGLNARSSLGKSEKVRTPFYTPDRIAAIFQRYFKWVHSDAFKVAAVLFFFGLVIFGVLMYERIRISPIMVSLNGNSPTGQLVSHWESLSDQDIQNFYVEDEEKFHDMVVSTHQVLIDSEKYDQAENFVHKISKSQPSPPRQSVGVKLAPHGGGGSIQGRGPVFRTVNIDPIENSNLISTAIDKLKARNPAQTNWHFHLLVNSDRTVLDLSGHANLRDISPLNGQVIHELDLTDTGVDNIFDLIGMPLDELRLCRTKVTDLDPVVGLPLRVLTFVDAPIRDISATHRIPSLRCLIGQDKNGPIYDIKPPLADQKTWINERGLKFRALPGTPVMMAANEFPAPDGMTPLTSITFKKAQNLCSHMTVRERKEGKISPNQRYRLPTDGEWSYAALLPESRFLSPRGRMLQRVNETDFANHQKSVNILEVCGKTESDEHFHNGFWNMNNIIGEWVDENHGHWDGTNLIRGLFAGTELENLRSRTWEVPEKSSTVIGFRPVLEIGTDINGTGSFDETDPEDLQGKTLDSWDAPHLKAAASSSFILKSLLTSTSYRDTFIANQDQNRDPFEQRFYLRVDVPMTWTRARAVAQQLGGRLATVTNQRHLAWITEEFTDNPLGTPLWMGASASPEKLDWKWVTNENVSRELRPSAVDTDKRRGALLSPKREDYSQLTAAPVSEKHAFLIEWDLER